MIRTVLLAAVAATLASAPAQAQRQNVPQAPPPAPAPGPQDWRTPDPENVLVIDTNKGRILVHQLPVRDQITIDVTEQLIVELYSK